MSADTAGRVFTVGHSTLALNAFLGLLRNANVSAVADVRSSPFSRRSPHFSRDELKAALKDAGIKYVFLGKELGGRPRTSNLYCDGVADYEKMAQESNFQKGIERVIAGAKEHTIALMCSEHNPLDCHRCLLVSRALAGRQITSEHIMSNGKIQSQHDIEEKLLALSGAANNDLLSATETREDRLAQAYRARAKSVAYRERPVDARSEMADPTSPNWYGYAP